MWLQPLDPSLSCDFGPDHRLPVPAKGNATGGWHRAGTGPSPPQGQEPIGESAPCTLRASAGLPTGETSPTSRKSVGVG